jgi:large conductance mechanosensitive channel
MFKEFKKFILRGSVVDLAVGIVIGASFTGIVNALVKDMITPFVAIFYHDKQFANAHFTIGGSQFMYGDLINNVITFIIIAAVVFFVVVQPINKLSEMAFRGRSTDEEGTKKCPYCLGKIPKEATKCMFCTSPIKEAD